MHCPYEKYNRTREVGNQYYDLLATKRFMAISVLHSVSCHHYKHILTTYKLYENHIFFVNSTVILHLASIFQGAIPLGDTAADSGGCATFKLFLIIWIYALIYEQLPRNLFDLFPTTAIKLLVIIT